MAFSQIFIDRVNPPVVQGSQLFVSWVPTLACPPGIWFQVYLNQKLTDWTTATSCYLPIPTGPLRVDIGTVPPGEEEVDFSASLPAPPHRRVTVSWNGGSFEGPDLAGFFVYGSPAGGAVDYTRTLADVAAFPVGLFVTGWGVGGFGLDGFGSPNLDSYSWTTGPLTSGTWTFAVKAYDRAGNLSTPQTTVAVVTAPPREPALQPDGLTRLTYVVDRFGSGAGFGQGGYNLTTAGLAQVTLNWLPSPS